jgi:hypothetical protein
MQGTNQVNRATGLQHTAMPDPAGQRRQGQGQGHGALPQQVPASVPAVQGQYLPSLLTDALGSMPVPTGSCCALQTEECPV